jgi:S-DNA-T family DNA segregation ATPase FtsK/SpoIIIE
MEEINTVLSNLNLDAQCIDYQSTNSSEFYDIKLGYKCSVKKFSNSLKELEFRLGSHNSLFLTLLPKSGCVRIQNLKNNLQIKFEDVYSKKEGLLPVILGKDYYDNIIFSDFSNHPHTLISGTTGSGKSMALHNIICNLLLKNNTELYLSDSKGVEFIPYERFSKISEIAKTYDENIYMLKKIHYIMESRFAIMRSKNQNNFQKLFGINPIAIIIDELSDLLIQDKDSELKNILLSIAQKSRAAGIFLIAATQRPSVDILSGTIKANFPARIALKAASPVDSKVILDQTGAEMLKGYGDAIINNEKYQFLRFKFPLINHQSIIQKIKK